MTFGPSPHDDRVLAIVLVMPGGETRRFVPEGQVEPYTPHAEEFWQDIGRPLSGHERTSEAMDAGAGVQRACPTHGERYMLGPYRAGQRVCSFDTCRWGWISANAHLDPPLERLGAVSEPYATNDR